MKEKCVTFFFIILNAKTPPNHRGKDEFSVQKLGIFIQSYYLLTLFPAEAIAKKYWKSKTGDYHQKLNRLVASRISERFRT